MDANRGPGEGTELWMDRVDGGGWRLRQGEVEICKCKCKCKCHKSSYAPGWTPIPTPGPTNPHQWSTMGNNQLGCQWHPIFFLASVERDRKFFIQCVYTQSVQI